MFSHKIAYGDRKTKLKTATTRIAQVLFIFLVFGNAIVMNLSIEAKTSSQDESPVATA
jgi:hypothetical protein